jgi:hypothetical protein
MNFFKHVSTRLFESSDDKLKDLLNDVSSVLTNKEDRDGVFNTLETTLDAIPETEIESNQQIQLTFSESGEMNWMKEYTENEKVKLEQILTEKKNISIINDSERYAELVNLYSQILNRLVKLNKIFELTGNTELKNLTVSALLPFSQSIKDDEAKIDSIPDTEEGLSQIETIKHIIENLGLSGILGNKLKEKSESISQRTRITNKTRIIGRLFTALQVAQLPTISNNNIIAPGGDYFRLFKALEAKNKPWMDLSLGKYVIRNNTAKLSEFNSVARNKESILEEHQIIYLHACRSWITSYIRSSMDERPSSESGVWIKVMTDHAEAKFISNLGSIVFSKEKEIKNYYISRDFNMSNFNGIQLKPNLKLPLYTKVKLIVSKEDRIKESPLRNILSGLVSVIAGMGSMIPYQGNAAAAEAAARQNRAIFNGVKLLLRGSVSAIGGKQAGRDFDKYSEKITGKPEGKLNEDTAPGVEMQTPDSMSGGMDTYSLVGPEKKKAKSKLKGPGKLLKYSDFIKAKTKS